MKKLFLLICFLCAWPCWAADGVGLFRSGLQAYQSNGADALLGSWFDRRDDAAKVERIRERLTRLTQDLGPVIDTEVFAPHDLGRHVQKLYGAIYFQKRPLWVRAEYYEINGKGNIITFEFSLSPDDVLPLTWAGMKP